MKLHATIQYIFSLFNYKVIENLTVNEKGQLVPPKHTPQGNYIALTDMKTPFMEVRQDAILPTFSIFLINSDLEKIMNDIGDIISIVEKNNKDLSFERVYLLGINQGTYIYQIDIEARIFK